MAFPLRFLRVACEGPIIRRAIQMSLVVGSILALINHGPELISFTLSSRRLFQIGLTYLVPYCVSTYAATMQELSHRRAAAGAEPMTARSATGQGQPRLSLDSTEAL